MSYVKKPSAMGEWQKPMPGGDVKGPSGMGEWQKPRPGDSPAPAAGGSPAPAQGGAMPAFSGGTAPEAKGQGTGFVNLQTLYGLNQGGGQQLAQGIEGNIANQAGAFNTALGAASGAAKPGAGLDSSTYAGLTGQADRTQTAANLTGSQGGLKTLLNQQYGTGSGNQYTQGQQGMDAFLAGKAGGSQLAGQGGQYAGLTQALTSADATAQKPAAAIAPVPGAAPPTQEIRDQTQRDRLRQRTDPWGRSTPYGGG